MSSKRETVLAAVETLIQTALPHADIARNRTKAKSVGPGGTVLIEDGEPGDPEVDLCPLNYTYSHRIPLTIGAYESASLTPEQVLDTMQQAIGAAVAADRTLGGLCEWLEPEAPDSFALDVVGAVSGRWSTPAIIAVYSTPNPL